MNDNFEETIQYVVAVLKNAGYNPYEQLWGYVATGNESYITRQGNAREIIKEIDIELIKNYLKYLKEKANARH